MARALQGLTLDESRHALRRALAVTGALDMTACSPSSMRETGRQPDGLIQYIADSTRIEHVEGSST